MVGVHFRELGGQTPEPGCVGRAHRGSLITSLPWGPWPRGVGATWDGLTALLCR